jgi:hypothetical protein
MQFVARHCGESVCGKGDLGLGGREMMDAHVITAFHKV